ncbi:alanyl-tRNA editing protein Aarsd1-A-like isoform X2 [Amphibalanus amphitrite]|uniref:alanyl-tRNA editing protein Aarsd1-A-like isoform X2 n=1 Tax=Amphibalanus amphitrite TaxID=1232801 RepID=UPI001C902188|nr:alanyl-tRNA editing protein Aarsd1-A-like isoform X2 [Amphibalanus amphitrite]
MPYALQFSHTLPWPRWTGRMVLTYQTDSYAQELDTDVVSCCAAEHKLPVDGRPTRVQCHEVVLADTVLFPEGGGQPDDRGTIGGQPVLRVLRRGAEPVHLLEGPLAVGERVHVAVDWARRWDHMQQHSAQHLITAVLDQLYGCTTTSWALREASFCTIELDSAQLTAEQLVKAEERANQLIREARPVTVSVHQAGDAALNGVRARGLPDDHVGAVRIVSIAGVDDNMCCGTHVSNLAHLQAVKLLSAERGKKGRTNVSFLAGQRLLDYVAESARRETQLNLTLKCGPGDYATVLDKWQRTMKAGQRAARDVLRQLADAEAERFWRPGERFLSVHQPHGDAEFMSAVVSAVGDGTVPVLVTVGGADGAPGSLLLSGPPALVERLGPRLCELMDGKGAGKNGRFSAKLGSLKQRAQADRLLREEIESSTES